MSQRNSGYARKRNDLYETPAWVTRELLAHLPRAACIWEPAAGNNAIAAVLRAAGHRVLTSDITRGTDFLSPRSKRFADCNAVVTNPPYGQAEVFIERALAVVWPRGYVAMLLRTDFDHAARRRWLFDQCAAFAKKLVLTRRIVWFAPAKASPSFNHCWFIWDWQHRGPPVLAYQKSCEAPPAYEDGFGAARCEQTRGRNAEQEVRTMTPPS